MIDQNDRDESESVRLTTEKKLHYRFDDIRNKSSASGDVVLSELHYSGEPDLDHVVWWSTRQSINPDLGCTCPCRNRSLGQRDRDLTPAV